MRIGDAIYNLDGLPFRSFGLATRMRELLSDESGRRYAVGSCPDGGFILRCEPEFPSAEAVSALRSNEPPGRAARLGWLLHRTEMHSMKAGSEKRAARVFRPAVLRANAVWLPVLGIGVLLAFIPHRLLSSLLALLPVDPSALDIGLTWTLNGLTLMGGLLSGALLFWLGTEWLSATYVVSETGVEAREGLVARDTVGLRFQDIRSITLSQSWFERLVNIGTLELASAGTDGRPVRFVDIARPGRVKALIQNRMNRVEGDD
ncbi:PH domain-containing protein [Methylocaldum gracile]|jgi:hypothetical protein|uniref:PH domain-containing protein n=1 Tax=Methylocaldum sp. 0917 TaxID=2485163 RepID=UPI00105B8F81